MKNYKFLTDLLLRSPFYSYTQYTDLNTEKILNDDYFLTALYLASPQLYDLLAGKNFDHKSLTSKERLSIKRYYNRMCFRPTPFGSFSSFTLASWGPEESISLDEQNTNLHLNIDQEIVLQLAERLVGINIKNYTYICNPTLYRSGKEFRFIKTNYSEDRKKILFDLESYEYNALTSNLINFCAGSFKLGLEIVAYIAEISGCDDEAAKDYLSFMVDAQLIIPLAAANIIGDDYLYRLLNSPGTPYTHFTKTLRGVYQRLQIVPFPAVNSLIKRSSQLTDLLSHSQKEKNHQFFYAGLERKVFYGTLSFTRQQQITDGLSALSTLAQPSILQQFIQDFKNRYDRQKVPLLQAIDPETGIGYGADIAPPSETELLRQINFKQAQKNNIALEWSAVHWLLFQKWDNNPHNTDPIVLNEADLRTIPVEQTFSSPPTLSVLFRVIDSTVYLETAGGVSATALIGRFTAWNKGIHNLSRQLASIEQSTNPDVVFADIGQLSDTHADNINRRKHSYEYEIPINAVSTLPIDKQIFPSDLLISVNGDKLILESKSLQKVIIPRLSSAYNYSRNDLALYRILCDLQYQGLQGNYSFELEQFFPGMAHYPRVVFKQAILCPAKWHLSDQDLNELKSAPINESLNKFKSIKEKLKFPSIIALSRFDQQLVFDTDREEEIIFLIDCLKGIDTAVLQEYFLPEQS